MNQVVAQSNSSGKIQVVSGEVVDNNGAKVVGATIVVQGTSMGTASSTDGTFELSLNLASNPILDVSCLGYMSESVAVGSKTNIKVVLTETTNDLNEIVVIGYGATKKKLLTGANLNLKGDEIANQNPTSAIHALQGIAPGVEIKISDGSPGASTSISIRGMGTVGDAEPLYVVDGMTVDDIDHLNPSDIESIDVLKDAASAAIYGARAANGVVLVTTKGGSYNNKTKVTYNFYYGIQNIAKKPSVLNAQQFMEVYDEAYMNDNGTTLNWENLIVNSNAWSDGLQSGLGTAYGQEIYDKLQEGWTGTDWIDEILCENAPIQSHNLSITGGSDNARYVASVSYLDNTGVVGGDKDLANTNYKRFTARLNSEAILFKRGKRDILKIGETFSYQNISRNAIQNGALYYNAFRSAIIAPPMNMAYWDQSLNENGFAPVIESLSTWLPNPCYTIWDMSNRENSTNKFNGNFYAVFEPIKNLVFRSSLGINGGFSNSRTYDPVHIGTYQNSTSIDMVSMSMSQWASYNWSNTVSYKHTFDEKHTITALVGNEVSATATSWSMSGTMYNSLFGDYEHAYLSNVEKSDIAYIDVSGKDGSAVGGGILSYMGRLSYSYDDKYMVDFTMRADGSSNFAPDKRWGYFPSVSVGWNFTEESFFDDIPVLDFGKLRASWGQNGNQTLKSATGTSYGFIYTSNVSYSDYGYYFDSSKGVSSSAAYPSNMPNTDATWETSEQLNFGIDARMFDSRLSASFDWYKKTTKDWLVNAPMLSTAGADAPMVNGGSILNQGFEFSLGWNEYKGEFKYGARLSIARNKNKVLTLDAEGGFLEAGDSEISSQHGPFIRAEVGMPLGYFYGYKTDGVLQNADEVAEYSNSVNSYYGDTALQPGDLRIVDSDGDGYITEADKTMIGNPHPAVQLGLQLNAEYKGFYTNITMNGEFGMQVVNTYFYNTLKYQNFGTQILDRWHGEGTSNTYPRLSTNDFSASNTTDIYVHDADYLRISNVTVGYNFKELLRDVKWVNDARVYVAVSNLCTFTSYEGGNPDISYGTSSCAWSSGVDIGNYPLTRTVMFGIDLTF